MNAMQKWLLRRLPEKKIPDCVGFLFGFKARQQAHSALCNCWRNAEAGPKDQQDGIFFDRNRLNPNRNVTLLGIGLMLFCLTAQGVVLQPFTAHYAVSWGDLNVGNAQVALQLDASGNYIYESASHAAGLLALLRNDTILERSRGRNEQGHIRPLEYLYKHDGSKKDRDARLIFDWHKSEVTNTKGRSWTLAIPPGTLDKFAMQLALALDLKAGRKQLRYTVADNGKLKNYQFTVIGKESMDTPFGSFTTVKLERSKNDKEPDTQIWLVPELQYLPVRVESERKGSIYRMEVQAVNGLGVTQKTGNKSKNDVKDCAKVGACEKK